MSLKTEELTKSYSKRRVVNGISLEIKQGEIVGLLGPNGAGKTTTFYMIIGILSLESGRIFLEEEKIENLPMYKRARKGIGYLSQEPSIFCGLTVEENITAILETMKIKKNGRKKILKNSLEKFGIAHLAKNMAHTLSGGEKRRLEISRALLTKPKYMLLDEPFTGVDPIARSEIQEVVKDLKKEGIGILITDHNVRETLEITDRAYIMYEGKILFSGTARELLDSQSARKVYLGPKFKM